MKSLNKFIILFFILILFISMRSNAVSAEFPFGNSKPFERVLINITINSENRVEFNRVFMPEYYNDLIYAEEASGRITYKLAIFASTGVIQRLLLRAAYFFPESYFELEKSANIHSRYYSIIPNVDLDQAFSTIDNATKLKDYYESALFILTRKGAIPAKVKFLSFDDRGTPSQVPSFVLMDLGSLSQRKRSEVLAVLRQFGIKVLKIDIQKNSARCFAYFN